MKHLDLTALDHEAEAAWDGVLDLAAACPEGWALAGGQAVFVQTVLRGEAPARPSSDADLVIDLRADPGAARNLVDALRSIGFEASRRDGNGRVHRWVRDAAQIDVLQPRHLGDRADRRLSRAGLETIGAPGSQHLLARTERVEVSLNGKSATIRTPTGLGIVVAKAAGFQEIIDDPNRVRHLADILTVGPLLSARDLRDEMPYTRLEKQRVGNAIGHTRHEKYATDLLTWFPTDLAQRRHDIAALHQSHSERSRNTGTPSEAPAAQRAPQADPWDGSWPHTQSGQGPTGPGHHGPSYGM